jgi:signal transduction histidine kinase
LAAKYALLLCLLVGIAQIFTATMEIRAGDRLVRANVGALQLAEAELAKVKIDEYLSRIDDQINATLNIPYGANNADAMLRINEMRRLLRMSPAISTLTAIDAGGFESAFVTRIGLDKLGLGASVDAAKLSLTKKNGKYVSPVYFLDGSEPHISVWHWSRFNHGIAAEINLKLVMSIVRQLKFANSGIVYVVDNNGKVITHPDARFSLSQLTIKQLGKITFPAVHSGDTHKHRFMEMQSFAGESVVASAVFLARSSWWVVAEQSKTEAFQPVHDAAIRSVVVFAGALILSLLASILVARLLSKPIISITKSAQKIAQGEFGARITLDRKDELGVLSGEFNTMASQLQDYTQNLEQKVADKTQQLELANKHKSEFLANMSHELRTPLNAVIGFSDALREEYFGSLNDKQREYVNDIALSGQHLLSLINDILDLSKIESGMMDLSRTNFSVASAIDNAMVLIRERAIRQAVTVTSEIGDGVDLLYADERKFKQVLINLLTNAVKFTYPNGWVKIRAEIEGTNLLVSVADSGLGIAEEDFETVFQEFRQLTSVGEATHEGTGLGLPLAKRIVELHGGRIWLTSELGKGATFLFVMPLGVSGDINLVKVQ